MKYEAFADGVSIGRFDAETDNQATDKARGLFKPPLEGCDVLIRVVGLDEGVVITDKGPRPRPPASSSSASTPVRTRRASTRR